MIIFMVDGASSAYLQTISSGQELDPGVPGAVSKSGPAVPNPYSPELKDVFFDRDSYKIRADAKPVLDENAEVMKDQPDMFIVIESYCDSREHSPSSLGVKRTASVREYVVSRGVDAEQVLTVNKCTIYDMQLVNSEDAVRLDSRVHFVVLDQSVGSDSLVLAR